MILCYNVRYVLLLLRYDSRKGIVFVFVIIDMSQYFCCWLLYCSDCALHFCAVGFGRKFGVSDDNGAYHILSYLVIFIFATVLEFSALSRHFLGDFSHGN